MEKEINILSFAGSLRKGSCNRPFLRAAPELVRKGARLQAFDLEGIPVFNHDPENEPLEGMVSLAQEKVNKDGRATNQNTREKISELHVAPVSWTNNLKGP